jgi:hypothetical protein
MSPYESDDLTEIIVQRESAFFVLRSSGSAGHSPRYRKIAHFADRKAAESFLNRHGRA